MVGPPPDELKFMSPYLQRATELQGKEPIVAYYSKYYAVQMAISKAGRSQDAKVYLSSMVDELEEDRKKLAGNEAITNNVVGYAHIENFALRIFFNADTEDRQGNATKKTAKTFLAASIFLDLLRVFGDIDSEVFALLLTWGFQQAADTMLLGQVQDKVRYSKFKAADIIKAIREGRVPTPGLPGEDGQDTLPPPEGPPAEPQHPDFGSPYDPTFNPNHLPPQPPTPFEPNSYPPPGQSQPPPPVQAPAPRAPAPSVPPVDVPSSDELNKAGAAYEMNFKSIQAAQKAARFAISALQYDDVSNAIENLEQALAILRPMKR
ncbi:hypothetical protein HKX48_002152 [Thoreauomyces humboldtii]|nr:hypothetical protein HKX48_002152 [Thoreauomyces humboldtii]